MSMKIVNFVKIILKKSKIIIYIYEKIMEKREKRIYRERMVTWGQDNMDKIFYVIRKKPGDDGLFSYVNSFLGLIEYAEKSGYIPVIDMQFIQNTYLSNDLLNKVNAWEYYFEQPCGYSMSDIVKSHNVILCGDEKLKTVKYPSGQVLWNYNEREKWKKIAGRYLRVKSSLIDEANLLFQKLFGSRSVLGVLCRGTDYVKLRPKDHPIQPEPDMVIRKVKEVLQTGEYDDIFLATEDEYVYQEFYKNFGKVLKTTSAKRYYDTYNLKLAQTKEFRDTDKYLNGKEYLINIILLSKCKGFIAGYTGGVYGAVLMKEGKYEQEYFFDLGKYC